MTKAYVAFWLYCLFCGFLGELARHFFLFEPSKAFQVFAETRRGRQREIDRIQMSGGHRVIDPSGLTASLRAYRLIYIYIYPSRQVVYPHLFTILGGTFIALLANTAQPRRPAGMREVGSKLKTLQGNP